MTWPHPLTYPSTQPPTLPPMGVSTNHKSSNRIELSWLGQHLTWTYPSTHPSTHPLTKPYTWPWVGNSQQISNLQTESNYLDPFKCYGIFTDSVGAPCGGGGWVNWGMGSYRLVRACPMQAHMHMHAHTHACCKHDKHGCLHGGSHLQFLYMYTCPCMHVHVCTCMCTCVETPPIPPTHLPPLQSHREPKTPKFIKS